MDLSHLVPQRQQHIRGNLSQASHFCTRHIKSVDRFGYPISLTYKNEQTFKSTFGGIMTIMSIFALCAYFFVMVSYIISNQNFVMTETKYMRNLYVDKREYEFTTNQFDLAVQPSYLGGNTSVTNIHQYFSVKYWGVIQKVKETYAEGEYPILLTYNFINTTRCAQSRFAGQSEDDNSRWFCPDYKALSLQGRTGSLSSKRIRVEFAYCENAYLQNLYPGQECKTREETDKIAKDTYFLLSYLDQFIDINEFEASPIKYSIQSFQYTPGMTDIKHEWFGISQNYFQVKDSWLASAVSRTNLTYSQVRRLATNTQIKDTRNIWMSVQFFLDDSVTQTTRTSYNTIDALTATGGFASIIMLVFKFLTTKIQKILYYISAMKRLYLYMDPQAKDQIANLALNFQKHQENNGPNQRVQENGVASRTIDKNKFDYLSVTGEQDQTPKPGPLIQNQKNKNKSGKYFKNQFEESSQRDLMESIRKAKQQDNPELEKENDKTQATLLKEKLRKLKFFEYSFTDYLKSIMRYFCQQACKFRNTQFKDTLFKIGVQKLQREFDMIRYLKKIRIADSVSELTLSEFQRELIPYFDRNILNPAYNNSFLKRKKTIGGGESQFHTSVRNMIRNSRKSEIDSKILQNIALEFKTIQSGGISKQSSKFSTKKRSLNMKNLDDVTSKNILNNDQVYNLDKEQSKSQNRKHHSSKRTKKPEFIMSSPLDVQKNHPVSSQDKTMNVLNLNVNSQQSDQIYSGRNSKLSNNQKQPQNNYDRQKTNPITQQAVHSSNSIQKASKNPPRNSFAIYNNEFNINSEQNDSQRRESRPNSQLNLTNQFYQQQMNAKQSQKAKEVLSSISSSSSVTE